MKNYKSLFGRQSNNLTFDEPVPNISSKYRDSSFGSLFNIEIKKKQSWFSISHTRNFLRYKTDAQLGQLHKKQEWVIVMKKIKLESLFLIEMPTWRQEIKVCSLQENRTQNLQKHHEPREGNIVYDLIPDVAGLNDRGQEEWKGPPCLLAVT